MVARLSRRAALLLGSALCLPVAVRAGSPSLPQGGTFTAGSGSITRAPGRVTVDQGSARGIIDWKSFSIGAGKTVAINNGSGATLNIVTGTLPSSINGTLTATGSAYLVNPQGVVVGKSGVISTGGSFVATTRPVDPQQFLQSGTLSLSGSAQASVVNQGQISAGDQVVLVGQSVRNSGSITAGGAAVLAAGDTMVLQAQGDNALVSIQGGSGDVTNEGRISAASVALRAAGGNVYALAGRRGQQSSAGIEATGTAGQPGRVMLDANGDVVVSGAVSADGASGGQVSITAGKTATLRGTVSARGSTGAGGQVSVDGATVSLGRRAVIDASGATGGGTVRIGGDRTKGASTTTIASGAQIKADGGSGPGGSVVVWSTGETDFAGHISATGTNGGSAEVSSQGVLSFTGLADLRGATGQAGTLLLDPNDVVITDGAVAAGQSAISPELISTQLGFSDFVIETDGTGASSAGHGDILVTSALSWISSHALTLSAARNITISAPITAGSGADVALIADSGDTGIGVVSFSGSGALTLAGGGTAQISTSFANAAGSLPGNANYTANVSGGTLSTTLSVANAAQLAALSAITAAGTGAHLDIDLIADINMSGVGYTPISSYYGVFNGQGHTISNLVINLPSQTNLGFVDTLHGTIENVTFYNSTVTGYSNVGLVAGTNDGTINTVTVTGTNYTTTNITGNNTGYSASDPALVGGMVGLNVGLIKNVYFNATVHGGFSEGGIAGYNGDGTLIGTIEQAQVYPDASGGYWSGGVAGQNEAGSIITNTFIQGGVYGTYTAGVTAVNYGQVSNVIAVNGATHGESNTGAVVERNLNAGTITNSYYDIGPYGRVSTYGIAANETQFYGGFTNGSGQLVNGGLPPGFDPLIWTFHSGGFPTVYKAYTAPASSAQITLSGTVSGAAAGATVGVNVGGTMYGPVTLSPTGTWSLSVPQSANGFNGGTDVVVSLLTGGSGSTLLADITGSTASVPLSLNTTTLSTSKAGSTTLSVLEAEKTATEGGSTLSLFGPADPTAQGATGLVISVPGAIGFDSGLDGTGTLQVTAGGDLTAGAGLVIDAVRLNVTGAVLLGGVDNQISTLAGQVGALSLQNNVDLTIGTVAGATGLASNGAVSLTETGGLTLAAALSATGSGNAMVIQAQSLTNTLGAAALSVSGGGRYAVYLPDVADITLDGLVAAHRYGVAAGATLSGTTNVLAFADQPTLTITPDSNTTAIYSGAVPNLTYSISGLVLGDTLGQAVSGTVGVTGAQANAGSYTLQIASGLTSPIGYILQTGTGTLDIAAKTITWAVANATATYGTQGVPGAVQLTGLVAGDSPVAALGFTSSGGGMVTLSSTTNAGSYTEAVTGLSGAGASNYQLAGSGNQTGTLTINPKTLTWAVANATATYGTQAVPGAVQLTGLVGGDMPSATLSITNSANAVVSLSATTNAGSYTEAVSALSGTGASNYQLAGSGNQTGTLTINPKTLTWAVANATATYGTQAVPGAVQLTGLVGGDMPSATLSITNSANAVISLAATTNAGSYTEAVSGLSGTGARNYQLAGSGNQTGTLTISPKTLTWAVANATATYGTQAVPGAVQLTGLVGGDSPVAGLGFTSSGGSMITLSSTTNAGSYTEAVSALSGTGASNYQLAGSGNQTGTLVISPKPLSWSVADAVSVYGTLPVPGAATLLGVLGSDQVSAGISVEQNGGSIALSTTTPVGAYQERVVSLAGASAGNYRLAASGNTEGQLTVQPAPVTASINSPSVLRDTMIPPLMLASFSAGTGSGATQSGGQSGTGAGGTVAGGSFGASQGSDEAGLSVAPPPVPSPAPAPVQQAPAPQAPTQPAPAAAPSAPATAPNTAEAPTPALAPVPAPAPASEQVAAQPPQPAPAPALEAPVQEAAAAPPPAPPPAAPADLAPPAPSDTPAAPALSAAPLTGLASGDTAAFAAAAAASGAPTLFNATLNQALASGASPSQALVAAQRAAEMLAAADTRGGAATPDQALGDAVATGGVADRLALAALQQGATPREAQATAEAAAAALAAQTKAAQVPQSAANQAAASLGAGDPTGFAGDPAVAALAASLLAAGGSPEQSLARAEQASLAREAMLQAAATKLSAAELTASALAEGDPASVDPAVARLLADGLSPADAAARAAAAQAERNAALRAAQMTPTDPQAASLAEGQVPAGQIIVVRDGQAELQADHRDDQIRAAMVDVQPGCIAGPDAADCVATELRPESRRVLAALLTRGLAYPDALREARQFEDQAQALLRRAMIAAPDRLETSLATGILSQSDIRALAGTTAADLFSHRFSQSLQDGERPLQALHESGGKLPSADPDTAPDASRTPP